MRNCLLFVNFRVKIKTTVEQATEKDRSLPEDSQRRKGVWT